MISLSLKDSETSDQPVRADTEVLVVDPALLGVHCDQRVADNVLEERPRVDLAEDEAERVRARVAEHDELVARERLEKVQLVRRGLVVDELLVSAWGGERVSVNANVRSERLLTCQRAS